jgi:hypothetical protein
MSSRIAFDSWQMLFPSIGFCIFAGIFVLAVIRVMRMSRSTVDHMERLPLSEEQSSTAEHVRTK